MVGPTDVVQTLLRRESPVLPDFAEAVPELGIVVYHNPNALKNRLAPEY